LKNLFDYLNLPIEAQLIIVVAIALGLTTAMFYFLFKELKD